MSVRPCPWRQATFLKKKVGRATFPEISKRWVEMSKSLSRDLRRRPTATEPSQAESQSQARPGEAEPIAPSSFTQLPQAPPICISGLRPGPVGMRVGLHSFRQPRVERMKIRGGVNLERPSVKISNSGCLRNENKNVKIPKSTFGTSPGAA